MRGDMRWQDVSLYHASTTLVKKRVANGSLLLNNFPVDKYLDLIVRGLFWLR